MSSHYSDEKTVRTLFVPFLASLPTVCITLSHESDEKPNTVWGIKKSSHFASKAIQLSWVSETHYMDSEEHNN